jgi:hypothetical protein
MTREHSLPEGMADGARWPGHTAVGLAGHRG